MSHGTPEQTNRSCYGTAIPGQPPWAVVQKLGQFPARLGGRGSSLETTAAKLRCADMSLQLQCLQPDFLATALALGEARVPKEANEKMNEITSKL